MKLNEIQWKHTPETAGMDYEEILDYWGDELSKKMDCDVTCTDTRRGSKLDADVNVRVTGTPSSMQPDEVEFFLKMFRKSIEVVIEPDKVIYTRIYTSASGGRWWEEERWLERGKTLPKGSAIVVFVRTEDPQNYHF